MTAERSGIRYQPIRAPRSHGEVLIRPLPLNVEELIAENRSRMAIAGNRVLGFAGIELETLRNQAREDVLRIARDHVSSYRDIPELPPVDAPIIVTGHQPALYHPGVWFKNFLADRVASRGHGTAINVIIDNDVAPTPSISALSGTLDDPRPARIAYDQPGPRVAWEMTRVKSMETLRNFDQRIKQSMEQFVADPLVTQFWPRVIEHVDAGLPLGLAFSAARNGLEASFGLNVLDVPLSRLCQTEWFCEILGFVLVNAKVYREIYNQSVQQYRDVHTIRSTSHPVPDLALEDNWFEVPFWIWTKENANRRRLWVSVSSDHVKLTDQAGWEIKLPNAEGLPALLRELKSQGVYIRPRALMTTTILRLVASDLFIHGIGGAKYDQVTDELNRQLFKFRPPEYLTATATALLPIDLPGVNHRDVQRIEHRLRDAEFNPDRAIDGAKLQDSHWQSLLEQKSSLLANVPEFPEKRSWHRQLEEVNSKLREQIAEPVARLRIERNRMTRHLHQKQLLTSREYSLLLFPIQGLQNLLLDLAEKEI